MTCSTVKPSRRLTRRSSVLQLLARLQVDGAQRLVEEQQPGAGAASARASATRWRSPPDSVCRPSLQQVRDAHCWPRAARGGRRSAGDAFQAPPRPSLRLAQTVGHVVGDAEMREQEPVLEDEADAAPLRGSAVTSAPSTSSRPPRTPAHAGDRLEHQRLAGAARARAARRTHPAATSRSSGPSREVAGVHVRGHSGRSRRILTRPSASAAAAPRAARRRRRTPR